jgi:hypothetical protein
VVPAAEQLGDFFRESLDELLAAVEPAAVEPAAVEPAAVEPAPAADLEAGKPDDPQESLSGPG